MQDALIDFGIGAFTGGLSVSASWGLLWLVVGLMGFSRGTCSWRVLLNSFAACLAPLLLVWAFFWMRGTAFPSSAAFAAGVSVIPLTLVSLGLRPAPDGRRAVVHMLEGVRSLMDDLLGKHRECGDCSHDHEPHKAEGG
jgi:hypothetical protein